MKENLTYVMSSYADQGLTKRPGTFLPYFNGLIDPDYTQIPLLVARRYDE
jgi:hypothetical protein